LAPTAVSASASESALLAFKNATTLLSNGFTTIRDVGSFGPGVDVALRNAIDAGSVLGPRMLVATKSLSITGGHADENALAPWLTPDRTYESAVAHGPYGFRELVRQTLKRRADCIKITATGGVLSYGDAWDAPQMNLDEIAAITDEAHKFGMPVAAHAHGDRGIATAVAGGCDSIEHCTGVSTATAEDMKQRGTFLVPTVWASESIRTGRSGASYPPALLEKAEQACALRDDGFARAIAAGVRFAYGTDCGVFPHEDNNKDFELLVRLGMTPLDVLASATANAAALLGKNDRGRIAPGLLADLVAFPGDVTEKIAPMGDAPAFLMLGGKQLA
jgi:imidazolonepropionase-like amidohydrolase